MKYGAFGLVEVLGSCNAVMVIDQMLKTADVSFRTWNGKCGGHEVVFMSGDVSAVTAAVESVKQNPPCDIILAAVISNPSEETVRLVEEDAATHHFAGRAYAFEELQKALKNNRLFRDLSVSGLFFISLTKKQQKTTSKISLIRCGFLI